MKNKLKNVLIILTTVLCLWLSITTFMQAMINYKLTNTELFLNIPNSIVLKFNR